MKPHDPLRVAVGAIALFAIVQSLRYDSPVELTGFVDTAIIIGAAFAAVIGAVVMLINETAWVSGVAFILTASQLVYQLVHGFALKPVPVPFLMAVLIVVLPIVFAFDFIRGRPFRRA